MQSSRACVCQTKCILPLFSDDRICRYLIDPFQRVRYTRRAGHRTAHVLVSRQCQTRRYVPIAVIDFFRLVFRTAGRKRALITRYCGEILSAPWPFAAQTFGENYDLRLKPFWRDDRCLLVTVLTTGTVRLGIL